MRKLAGQAISTEFFTSQVLDAHEGEGSSACTPFLYRIFGDGMRNNVWGVAVNVINLISTASKSCSIGLSTDHDLGAIAS